MTQSLRWSRIHESPIKPPPTSSSRCSRAFIAKWTLGISLAILGTLCLLCVWSGFFEESEFFRVGVPVTILSVQVTDVWHYGLLWFIVFMNALSSQTMVYFVAPYLHRRILGVEKECIQQPWVFLGILGCYDVWKVARTLILLLGITSQLGLMIASGVGSLIASQICMYVYVHYPFETSENAKHG
jgi:hypothetical protein